MKSANARPLRRRPASGREAAGRPHLLRPGLTVNLGEILDCLQEITDDDRLVVAVVADLMERGLLRAPAWGIGQRWAAA